MFVYTANVRGKRKSGAAGHSDPMAPDPRVRHAALRNATAPGYAAVPTTVQALQFVDPRLQSDQGYPSLLQAVAR